MTNAAIMNMPIADRDIWDGWMRDSESGAMSDEHREFLQRRGVTAEHVYVQETPEGPMMTLIWEGITQDDGNMLVKEVSANPTEKHERYMVEELMPKAHGFDPRMDTLPPVPEHIVTIEA